MIYGYLIIVNKFNQCDEIFLFSRKLLYLREKWVLLECGMVLKSSIIIRLFSPI